MQIWSEINRTEYFFKRNEAVADVVKKLTKAEILDFFKVTKNKNAASLSFCWF